MFDLDRVWELLELAGSGVFSESFTRGAFYEVARCLDEFTGREVTEEIDELLSAGDWDVRLEEVHKLLAAEIEAVSGIE